MAQVSPKKASAERRRRTRSDSNSTFQLFLIGFILILTHLPPLSAHHHHHHHHRSSVSSSRKAMLFKTQPPEHSGVVSAPIQSPLGASGEEGNVINGSKAFGFISLSLQSRICEEGQGGNLLLLKERAPLIFSYAEFGVCEVTVGTLYIKELQVGNFFCITHWWGKETFEASRSEVKTFKDRSLIRAVASRSRSTINRLMDTNASLHFMNQEFAKLDQFDGQNYTRWAEKVKFMLHVLKLSFVLDPKLAPIPDNPIPKEGESVDPAVIAELEKQRILHRESEELCVGHIKNSLSDRLYDLYSPVKDPKELWSALELKYKAHEEGTNKYLVSKYLAFQMVGDKSIMEQVHELQVMVNKLNALSISLPELFQVGAIIAKLPPSWKDFSKRMMHKSENYSLDDLMKHLRIEEETRIRDKRGKVGQSVHHVSAGSSSHKGESGGQKKKNFGPKKQNFKKPGHQNPNSKPKRVDPCHVCGEIGHYARECKDHKSVPVAQAVEKVTDMVASVNLGEIFMISSLTRAICARGWFMDTGATVHVCGQRESFRTYQPIPHGTVVACADGHRAEVLGRGDVRLKFTRGEWVNLRDVLHVPTISKGLVFADKFDKGGFKMVLERGKIVITKGRRHVGRANNTSGMYRLCLSDEGNMSGPSVESGVSSVASVSSVGNDVIDGLVANVNEVNFSGYIVCSISLWHKHLAHTNFTKKPFPSVKRNTSLLELIHSDICELNGILTRGGKRTTSRVIPTNPYELWKGRKPNLDYLKVWGCVAYYRTPDPKRTKLGARANKSIFIGYAQNSKAYRLIDIDSGVVVESRDVEFFEDKFSKDEENSSHTTPTSTSREILPPPPIVEEPRRSTRARIEKTFGDDFYSYLVEGTQKKVTREVIFSINLDDDPKTFTEAMTSRDAPLWKEAINDEMDSIMGNGTWELADLPKGRRPIGSKWIFKKKYHPDGSIFAYKARLLAKGYRQREGIDYFDTYAPVARISSIRTLIAISALKGLYIHQMDVKTTFLNGYLKEEIYLEQHERFIIPRQENKVCRLVKSLYGLKKAPKQWHERFDTTVTAFGFQHNSADRCIYFKHTSDYIVVICLYVDDMLIIGTHLEGILETKKYLSSNFKMKDLGEVDTILGIKVKRTGGQISLSQSHYIEKIMTKFQHLNIKEFNTPFDSSVKLKVNFGRAVAQLEYASVVGSMMYATHCTRPDIAFVVYTLAGGAISWASKKHTCIAHSMMEAELIALAAAGKEAEWIRDLLMDIRLWDILMPSIPMYCDSEATLSKVYNVVYNGKSRHVGLRHNFVRQLIESGTIKGEAFDRTAEKSSGGEDPKARRGGLARGQRMARTWVAPARGSLTPPDWTAV
uniref:CCHC-type domain-containing protein n=1 Tax=Lactuca sativa TaxID=4236 RepID=A0A9R1UNE8_LACSA|nr:hypothetical protein LSAT_V11C800406370 [Lactuca sativa]